MKILGLKIDAILIKRNYKINPTVKVSNNEKMFKTQSFQFKEMKIITFQSKNKYNSFGLVVLLYSPQTCYMNCF